MNIELIDRTEIHDEFKYTDSTGKPHRIYVSEEFSHGMIGHRCVATTANFQYEFSTIPYRMGFGENNMEALRDLVDEIEKDILRYEAKQIMENK